VTTYKAQGASKKEMIRVEDNRSLVAIANREDLHVASTRHPANARIFVRDIGVLRQVANRSLIKDLTARDLETRGKYTYLLDKTAFSDLLRLGRQPHRDVRARKREASDGLPRRIYPTCQ
jgi:hypothetical protein